MESSLSGLPAVKARFPKSEGSPLRVLKGPKKRMKSFWIHRRSICGKKQTSVVSSFLTCSVLSWYGCGKGSL